MSNETDFDPDSIYLEDEKNPIEEDSSSRKILNYRNYRGLYSPDVQFTETERSRVFIKVTKTKTLAAYGQIIDVLLSTNRFPISIDPTELPEGILKDAHFDPREPPQVASMREDNPYGFSGDGKELPPGATQDSLVEQLGASAKKLEGINNVKEGPGVTPTAVTISPAMIAAKKMEKLIHDQLEESGASKHLRTTAFEMALFGTGVMKGPFAVDKEYADWDIEGNYTPTIKTVPQVNYVSVWNFYPDPDSLGLTLLKMPSQREKAILKSTGSMILLTTLPNKMLKGLIS